MLRAPFLLFMVWFRFVPIGLVWFGLVLFFFLFFACALHDATFRLAAGIIVPAQDKEGAEEDEEDAEVEVFEFEPDWETSDVEASFESWEGDFQKCKNFYLDFDMILMIG